MAQHKLALAATLNTITDTAGAISGVVNTISNTLEMANNFVRFQQKEQRKDHKITSVINDQTRIIEASKQVSALRKEVADLLQDPEIASYYNEEYTRFSALMAED